MTRDVASTPRRCGTAAKSALFMIWALAFGFSGDCSQTSETMAADLAKAAIRKTLGGDVHTFVTATRDPALESEFARCFNKPPNLIPFIFRASNEGEEVRSQAVTAHLSVEGPLNFIIAVSDTGDVFQIRGADHSRREIENLSHRYRIELGDVDAARSFLRFYLAVNPENRIPASVESAAAVKDAAKRKLRAAFGDEKGASSFELWWQQHREKVSKLDFEAEIVQFGGDSFSARFYALSDLDPKRPQEGPSVLRATLKMSAEGKVAGLHLEPLWH
jgi:hypothetical protein